MRISDQLKNSASFAYYSLEELLREVLKNSNTEWRPKFEAASLNNR